jgi:hypothetical protein
MTRQPCSIIPRLLTLTPQKTITATSHRTRGIRRIIIANAVGDFATGDSSGASSDGGRGLSDCEAGGCALSGGGGVASSLGGLETGCCGGLDAGFLLVVAGFLGSGEFVGILGCCFCLILKTLALTLAKGGKKNEECGK